MSVIAFLMLASVFGIAFYLLLSRRYVDVVIGVVLVSNGANFLLLESSQEGSVEVDPLPQALILTAIVIGLALVSFLTAFVRERLREDERSTLPSIDGENGA